MFFAESSSASYQKVRPNIGGPCRRSPSNSLPQSAATIILPKLVAGYNTRPDPASFNACDPDVREPRTRAAQGQTDAGMTIYRFDNAGIDLWIFRVEAID